MTESPAVVPPPAAEEPPRPEVLELYKIAVEMSDRVSARRGTANTFYLSLQSAMVTLVGFGEARLAEASWWVSLAIALAGITLSATWWLQLRSYRDLKRAKFTVINRLEAQLPVRIFADEWESLRQGPAPGRRTRYAELGTSERVVPVVFAAVHLVLLAGALSQ